jgi:hypothetical protein
MARAAPGVRRSIADIQRDYDNGDKAALEKLMRAWKGIKELPPSDPNSFYMIGGFHGEPFRGPVETDLKWWGGYCHHGTVLFPSWHRAYLWRLEKALQSNPGCEDVMLPFWDECSDESRDTGKDMCMFTELSIRGREKEWYADHPETERILKEMLKRQESVLTTTFWVAFLMLVVKGQR